MRAATYDEALAVAQSSTTPAAERRRRLVLTDQAILYQRLGRDGRRSTSTGSCSIQDRRFARGNRHSCSPTSACCPGAWAIPSRRWQPTTRRARCSHGTSTWTASSASSRTAESSLRSTSRGRRSGASVQPTRRVGDPSRGNKREMLHARLYRAETILRDRGSCESTGRLLCQSALARELALPGRRMEGALWPRTSELEFRGSNHTPDGGCQHDRADSRKHPSSCAQIRLPHRQARSVRRALCREASRWMRHPISSASSSAAIRAGGASIWG